MPDIRGYPKEETDVEEIIELLEDLKDVVRSASMHGLFILVTRDVDGDPDEISGTAHMYGCQSCQTMQLAELVTAILEQKVKKGKH
jgi:hypothetical protein